MLMDQLQYYVDHDKSEKYIKRMQEAINALLKLYHGAEDLQTQTRQQDETIEELQRRYKKLMQMLDINPELLALPTWYLDSICDDPINIHDILFNYDAITDQLCSLENIGQLYASSKEDMRAEQPGTDKYQQLSYILEQLYQVYTQTIQNIYTLYSAAHHGQDYVAARIAEITNKYQVYYNR